MFSLDSKILPNCFASVVIPARNEALHLRKSLESLSGQVDSRGKTLNYDHFEIIILTNNCSDNSFEIARQFQMENKFLNLHVADIKTSKENANSGFIRRVLMEKAHERLMTNDKKDGMILTTDGDTQVAPNWIAENISEKIKGADAVGGRILFDDEELVKMNPAARKFHLIDEKYRLLAAEFESRLDFLPHDSFPRHHQHFNGSFAVTTDAYRKAGGIPKVRFLEDVAFYQSLMRIDAKFRHSPHVKVYTSARETGRTEAGLSTQINDWINLGKNGEDFFVESVETLEKRFSAQGKLRSIWKNIQNGFEPKLSEIKVAADLFNVNLEDLRIELLKPQTFGLLLENVFRMHNHQDGLNLQNKLVPVQEAVNDLENKLNKIRLKSGVSAGIS